MEFTWKPMQHFGARVELDLSRRPSDGQIAILRRLYDEYGLLLFERQDIDYETNLEVASWFGPAIRQEATPILSPDPERGAVGPKELAFHSDLACTPDPLEGLSLYAVDVDEGKVSTLFVDAAGAAARLPAKLRERISELKVLNLWPTVANSSERNRGSGNVPDDWPGTAYPVLYSHPRTGRTILFPNAMQSERILDLAPDEGEELIRTLFGYLYDEEFIFEHFWKVGDLIVWDNLALQHGRREVPPGLRRDLRRIAMGVDGVGRNMPAEYKNTYSLS